MTVVGGKHDLLALGRDGAGRMLLAVVAVMTVLATLAVAAALAAHGVENRWQRQLAGVMTVRIPPVTEADSSVGDDQRQNLALEVLARVPGVAGAVALDPARSVALLTPWLGAEVAANLPLARLIDIRLTADSQLSAALLQRRLRQVVPGAIVDDHRRWFKDVSALTKTIAAVGAAVLLLVALATTAVIALAVRTGVQVHREQIELVHIMGASDGFIANQFQWHVFRRALWGASGGTAVAGAALWAVTAWQTSAPRLGLADLGGTINFVASDWLTLAAIPPTTAVLALVVARGSVLLTLARLP